MPNFQGTANSYLTQTFRKMKMKESFSFFMKVLYCLILNSSKAIRKGNCRPDSIYECVCKKETHHDQVEFIRGLQRHFNIEDLWLIVVETISLRSKGKKNQHDHVSSWRKSVWGNSSHLFYFRSRRCCRHCLLFIQ